MKENIKEWIFPMAILSVIVIGYIYLHYPKEAQQVTQQFQDKPYVSYRNDALYIDEFNNLENDAWDKLNTKVYDILKGKTGRCEVFILHKETDKYGNPSSNYNSIGYLNIDELNKYTAVEFWIKAGGIEESLIKGQNPAYNKSSKQISTDTAVVESQAVQSTSVRAIDSIFVTYDFNKMVNKPWSYYAVENDKLNLISPQDDRITAAIQYWDIFINDIKDIHVYCSQNHAQLVITTKNGDSNYKLNMKKQYTYALSGNPSIGLEINPDHCELFFINGNKCASVDSRSLDPLK